MPIDWNKPIQLADGRKARVLCQDAKISYGSKVVLVTYADGSESVQTFRDDGTRGIDDHVLTVINVPEPKFRIWNQWVVLHAYSHGIVGKSYYRTYEEAHLSASSGGFLAMFKIAYKEDANGIQVFRKGLVRCAAEMD